MNRQDFPILKKRIGGRPHVYFDNAATAHKPLAVLKAIDDYYRRHNANVHRALNPLAEEATGLYESGRDTVAAFISAHREEIIFTRGATEGINLVARTWGEVNLKRNDIILLSQAEHHANIVPWLQLKERRGVKIAYIPLAKDGSLDGSAARRLLAKPRVKLLALTQASNVLGIINPVKELIGYSRARGIVTLLDSSQMIAHRKVDVRSLGCDFLVFSGHKLGGPTGIGVLYGRRKLLEKMPPFMGGGDMINQVREDYYTMAPLPWKFEAGTPHIAGVIGLAAACAYLNGLGWPRIAKAENDLIAAFMKGLRRQPFIRLVGTARPRLPIFSLTVDQIHPHDLADFLGQAGIILRAGRHCAEPLHEYLGLGATLRASLSFYNTKEEISYFFKKLAALYRAFSE